MFTQKCPSLGVVTFLGGLLCASCGTSFNGTYLGTVTVVPSGQPLNVSVALTQSGAGVSGTLTPTAIANPTVQNLTASASGNMLSSVAYASVTAASGGSCSNQVGMSGSLQLNGGVLAGNLTVATVASPVPSTAGVTCPAPSVVGVVNQWSLNHQ